MNSHHLFSFSPSNSSINLNDSPPIQSKSSHIMSKNKSPDTPTTSGIQKIGKKKQPNACISPQSKQSESCISLDVGTLSSTVVDHDSDSMSEHDFFSKATSKLPYSTQEDECILKFVLKGENIYKTGSISLWKQLEYKKDNPKRTYQSLKNRFLRNIKPYIFTTYGYMVKDEETRNKVLSKYPELKKTYGKKETLSILNLPNRDAIRKEILRSAQINPQINQPVAGKGPTSRASSSAVTAALSPRHLEFKLNVFSEKTHRKKVELKDNSILVTFCCGVYVPNKRLTHSPGLYEKYLKLKKNNVLIPCPRCGNCGPELDKSMDSESEGDLIIASSEFSSQKSNSDKNSPKNVVKNGAQLSSTPLLYPKLRKRIGDSQQSCSPSLLSDVTEVEGGSGKRRRSGRINQLNVETSENQTKNAEELLSDKDLDSLYRETVAHCRMFMDSDSEEEEEENSVKRSLRKTPKAIDFPAEKTNAESFFVNSDFPHSLTPAKETTKAPKSPKKTEQNKKKMEQDKKKTEQEKEKMTQDKEKTEQEKEKTEQEKEKAEQDMKKPLAENMVKMLKKSSRKK